MKKRPLLLLLLILASACKKGADSGSDTSQISTTNPTTTTTTQTGWVQLKAFPGGKRAYGSALLINGVGYVASGISYNTVNSSSVGFDDLWQYNPDGDSWTRKADMPAPAAFDSGRRRPFSYVINGKGYLGGGITSKGDVTRDINMFDPTTNSWTTVTRLTTGYFNAGFAASAQNVGNIVNLDFTNGVLYLFYPNTNQLGKGFLTIGSSNQNYYSWCSASDALLVGDDSGQIISLSQNELTQHVFDAVYPTGGKPVFTQAINYNNAIYQSFGDIGNLYKFDLVTRMWSLVINKTLGISEGAVCFNIGSKIYIIGGYTGSLSPYNGSSASYSDSVWMIDLNHVK